MNSTIKLKTKIFSAHVVINPRFFVSCVSVPLALNADVEMGRTAGSLHLMMAETIETLRHATFKGIRISQK